MIDTSSSTEHRLGYVLLRDGHAIPLRGISPCEIKHGAKHGIPNFDAPPLPHRQTLNAIVNRLGFSGDFGTYLSTGWPNFERFLKLHKCTDRVGVFPVDHGGCIDLHFAPYWGPSPRQLADRIFESQYSCPKRVFLGYGVTWSAWDNGMGMHAPAEAIASIKCDQKQAARLAEKLFAQRFTLMSQWGFLDDKLIHGDQHLIIDKSYFPSGFTPEEKKDSHAKIVAAIRAFRAVFNKQDEGWVDVLKYNERLVVLRVHDGCWDLLWRSYRNDEPPKPSTIADANGTSDEDQPLALRKESQLRRALYLRQEIWDEREEHLAEQAFYNRGGSIPERQLTNSTEVRIAWLREEGKWSDSEKKQWKGLPPDDFHILTINGRKVAISNIIDVGSFSRMMIEQRNDEKRPQRRDQEPWQRGNDGASNNAPVTASWVDAQTYCAWRERQLGASLRLPSRTELRAIRPAYSKHYESMALREFPWENYPPRPIVSASKQASRQDVPSAVIWSEPRFKVPSPDVPEFPSNSGWSDSTRKRWITDFPPRAVWKDPIPWAEHEGLTFIDAWDAYEWCQEQGMVSGRFWEGSIAPTSWGAYKNIKITFRVVMDLED